MKRILIGVLLVLGLSVVTVGCSGEKKSTTTTVKEETPKGSDTKKVIVEETKTGDQKETPPNP